MNYGDIIHKNRTKVGTQRREIDEEIVKWNKKNYEKLLNCHECKSKGYKSAGRDECRGKILMGTL